MGEVLGVLDGFVGRGVFVGMVLAPRDLRCVLCKKGFRNRDGLRYHLMHGCEGVGRPAKDLKKEEGG